MYRRANSCKTINSSCDVLSKYKLEDAPFQVPAYNNNENADSPSKVDFSL
jgi:hypothetical protein